jgi:hypothetical protein
MSDRNSFSDNRDLESSVKNSINGNLTSDQEVTDDSPGIDVSQSSANRKQHPEIGSRGRGPVKINDPDTTMLNEGIFENTNNEYFDSDLYR